MFIYSCELCGANLDPGERCTCLSEPRTDERIPDDPATISLKEDGLYHLHVWGDCFDYVAATLTLAMMMKETLLLQFKNSKNQGETV